MTAPRHNHFTRDLKRPGVCPACDLYRERFSDGGTGATSAAVTPSGWDYGWGDDLYREVPPDSGGGSGGE